MAGSKFDRVDRSDDRVFTTLGMSFLPRSITSDHVAETRNLDGDFRGDRATNPFRRRIVTRGKLRNREALRGAKGDIGVRTGTHFRGAKGDSGRGDRIPSRSEGRHWRGRRRFAGGCGTVPADSRGAEPHVSQFREELLW